MSSVQDNKRMPVLFIGHGSPLNAIETNRFTKRLTELAKDIPTPKAILCVSAHWLTEGTFVTQMDKPKTVHDFYGFPKQLFDVQYPCPGSPELARKIQGLVKMTKVEGDHSNWGIDHGAWSILKYMYPKADIPVIQMSLDSTKSAKFHFHVGEELKSLRDEGVLILGSGNIVHNLRWINFNPFAKPFDWAIEFDEWVKQKLVARDFATLQGEFKYNQAYELSVPTTEHFYPLHYVLGATDPSDKIRFEYEGVEHSSISMRSFSFGLA